MMASVLEAIDDIGVASAPRGCGAAPLFVGSPAMDKPGRIGSVSHFTPVFVGFGEWAHTVPRPDCGAAIGHQPEPESKIREVLDLPQGPASPAPAYTFRPAVAAGSGVPKTWTH